MRAHSIASCTIAALLLLSACSQAGPSATPLAASRGETSLGAKMVAGRLLVTWKDPAKAAGVLARMGLNRQDRLVGTDTDVVSVPSGMTAETFQAAAGAEVVQAEPDYVAHTYLVPNDPQFHKQYALQTIRAPQAWDATRGSADVAIAIIDTGVDPDHPDLKNQIIASYNAVSGRGQAKGSARDDNGHGTHCAGIAAAETNNGEGIAGVAPGCRLMVVKALLADGSGSTSDIARGMNWAVANGAKVVSLSMGCTEDSSALRLSVAHAIASGVTVVAAMGNEGKTLRNYPAAYPGVIAVGATNPDDRPANYSTRGTWISVSAPGTAILSTTPTYPVYLSRADQDGLTPTYGQLTGTSMATPMVAGVAALLKSQHPDWFPAQIKQAIEQSTDRLQATGDRVGRGRLNAAAALR